jgi:DnaJ-class molecular chaperone
MRRKNALVEFSQPGWLGKLSTRVFAVSWSTVRSVTIRSLGAPDRETRRVSSRRLRSKRSTSANRAARRGKPTQMRKTRREQHDAGFGASLAHYRRASRTRWSAQRDDRRDHICPKCDGRGIVRADGLLNRVRALFSPPPCPVCDGNGEAPQKVAAERLAGETIGKAQRHLR